MKRSTRRVTFPHSASIVGLRVLCYNRGVPGTQTLKEAADLNLALNQREYQEKRTALQSFPYHIQMGADNRCNLRCGFCLAAAYREVGEVHIQDRKLAENPVVLFEKLVPYMPYWKYLSLTGPGESLLNPRLDEILCLVRKHSECVLVVTTNGVLINARLAEIFLEHRVEEISISMDSLTREIYEELRVNARFDQVIRAIDLLNDEKRRRKSPLPRLNLTPNFSRKNIHELPNFIRFARDNGIHVVQATPTQIYRRSWVQESLLHHPHLTRKMAEEAERLAADLGVKFVNGLKMVYASRPSRWKSLLGREEKVDFPIDPSTCLKPWSSIYVEPDGEVRPCCYASPILGNLLERDFPSIWNGDEAQSLRRSMIQKDPPALCRDCYEFNRHDPSIMIQIKEE